MNKIFPALVIVFLISTCGAKPAVVIPASTTLPLTSTQQSLLTVTPDCISPEPTPKDIDRALAYTGDTFSASDWEQNYIVSESSVAVTWQNIPQGALAYLELLILPCGEDEPDSNKYDGDEYWKAIFQNYESYELAAECKLNSGLRLYQFKTQNQGFEYDIKYWEQNDTDTRVISTMIVFPVGSDSLIDDYSLQLFPTLPTCP